MTPDQCRQARELLGWTTVHLAAQAGIRPSTLRYAEGPHGRPKARTLAAIRTALETAGVIFVDPNGDGPEVRLQKAAP